jgi:hypothetical protein
MSEELAAELNALRAEFDEMKNTLDELRASVLASRQGEVDNVLAIHSLNRIMQRVCAKLEIEYKPLQ